MQPVGYSDMGVRVDTCGYIYLDDKHWGLFILRDTGPDQPKPTFN